MAPLLHRVAKARAAVAPRWRGRTMRPAVRRPRRRGGTAVWEEAGGDTRRARWVGVTYRGARVWAREGREVPARQISSVCREISGVHHMTRSGGAAMQEAEFRKILRALRGGRLGVPVAVRRASSRRGRWKLLRPETRHSALFPSDTDQAAARFLTAPRRTARDTSPPPLTHVANARRRRPCTGIDHVDARLSTCLAPIQERSMTWRHTT